MFPQKQKIPKLIKNSKPQNYSKFLLNRSKFLKLNFQTNCQNSVENTSNFFAKRKISEHFLKHVPKRFSTHLSTNNYGKFCSENCENIMKSIVLHVLNCLGFVWNKFSKQILGICFWILWKTFLGWNLPKIFCITWFLIKSYFSKTYLEKSNNCQKCFQNPLDNPFRRSFCNLFQGIFDFGMFDFMQNPGNCFWKGCIF